MKLNFEESLQKSLNFAQRTSCQIIYEDGVLNLSTKPPSSIIILPSLISSLNLL
jgi:hypothetical protein